MKLERLNLFGDQFALSWAVCADNVIHVAGMVGMEVDFSAQRIVDVTFPDGVEAQMRQCYRNIAWILEALGSSLTDIADQTMFATGDMAEVTAATSKVRGEVFGDRPPASATVGVAQLFHPRCRLEMKVIAYRGAGV